MFMVEPNVHPRLQGVASSDVIDLPERLQTLADIVSSYVPHYAGADARDEAWSDADPSRGGICQLDSDPDALYYLNPATGLWGRLTPERPMDRGRVKFNFAAGQAFSDVVTVPFAVPFVEPPVVLMMRRRAEGSSQDLDPAPTELPTTAGFKAQARLTPAPSSAGSQWVDWVAI